MSGTIVRFPPRGRFDVRVEREANGLGGWLVLLPDRSHAWLWGDFDSALRDASTIAADLSVSVASSRGI
jgi:hypothetical protein